MHSGHEWTGGSRCPLGCCPSSGGRAPLPVPRSPLSRMPRSRISTAHGCADRLRRTSSDGSDGRRPLVRLVPRRCNHNPISRPPALHPSHTQSKGLAARPGACPELQAADFHPPGRSTTPSPAQAQLSSISDPPWHRSVRQQGPCSGVQFLHTRPFGDYTAEQCDAATGCETACELAPEATHYT